MNFLTVFGVQETIMVAQLALELGKIGVIIGLLKGFFNELILKIVRHISYFIDSVLLNLIDKFYDYFYLIINNEIFDSEFIKQISTTIYMFIGILIFFKVVITIINYVVNPEKMEDKRIGGEKLIKKIVFSVLTIALIPFIFNLGLKLQGAILNDNIIEKVILADQYNEITKSNVSHGKILGFTIFNGFFTLDERNATTRQILKYERAQNRYSLDPIPAKYLNSSRLGTEKGVYGYKYYPVISTIALFFTLSVIIKLTIDVAVRVLKLYFLQFSAPFAISSSIISTEEDDSLKRWLKTTISTYLSIFGKVATIWFLVLFERMISQSDFIVSKNDLLLKALLSLAVFVFVKDAPKFLGEIFNIKQESDTTQTVLSNLGRNIFRTTRFVGRSLIRTGVNSVSRINKSITGLAKPISTRNSGIKNEKTDAFKNLNKPHTASNQKTNLANNIVKTKKNNEIKSQQLKNNIKMPFAKKSDNKQINNTNKINSQNISNTAGQNISNTTGQNISNTTGQNISNATDQNISNNLFNNENRLVNEQSTILNNDINNENINNLENNISSDIPKQTTKDTLGEKKPLEEHHGKQREENTNDLLNRNAYEDIANEKNIDFDQTDTTNDYTAKNNPATTTKEQENSYIEKEETIETTQDLPDDKESEN